ncbi:MAG TPA: tetratricopeptide repeat protein [Thermoflexales bacterium]|nr:tetratricopeptide repeat protein [Thermoflexales bacterium]
MSHPFGDLLSQYLHRKHGLSQARLAEGVLLDPAVVTRMCKGERLTGPQARERVLSIIAWLHRSGALGTRDEANALLAAAGMSGLREANLLGQLSAHHGEIPIAVAPGIDTSPVSGSNRGNLPVMATPFIGREADLTKIGLLLADTRCRILTLAGPGGVGKTRLAVETAALRRKLYPHGAYFVNLQPVAEVNGLPAAISEALGMALSGGEAPAAQLQRYLANKRAMLVLDNFEHLTSGSEMLSELLAAAPGVQALITSREVLNLQEEWQYAVGGVDVPPSGAPSDTHKLLGYDGVRLFIECARRVAPYDPFREPYSVARICQLTDGVPLAIEMAAAWTRTMTCADIVRELLRGRGILTNRQRNAPSRHSSMQTVFEQSWQMLTFHEQNAFERLSIFSGGFTRAAAAAIAGANDATLTTLVDKSFLQVASTGRFQIHELLRQYGEEKLAQSSAEHEQVLERHARYYVALLCDEASPHIPRLQLGSLSICQAEMDNFRKMWRWAVNKCDGSAVGRTAGPLYFVHQFRCSYLECADALGEASSRLKAEPETYDLAAALFEVQVYLGLIQLRLGQLERAEGSLSDALWLERTYRIPIDLDSAGEPLAHLSMVAAALGDYIRAEDYARQALAQPRQSGDMMCYAIAQYALSSALVPQGKLHEASLAIGNAIDLCRLHGSLWFQGYCLIALGNIEAAGGNWRAAVLQYQLAHDTKMLFGDAEGMAAALNKLGDGAIEAGDAEGARLSLERSLALYRDLNDRGGLATTLRGLGDAARIAGEYRIAATHYRESLIIARDMRYVSLIFALLVAVADLFFRTGHHDTATKLAALARHHPSSDHVSSQRARDLLVQRGHEAAQPVTGVDWDAAFDAACDTAARALDVGAPAHDQAAEWQPTDGYLSD